MRIGILSSSFALLLSRMDAGRLRIEFNPVNLTQLVDEWLDDLSALPDAFDVDVRKHLPPALHIAGEKRYTSLIVQNLLENARKYNLPGGRIQVRTEVNEAWVVLVVGNTGPAIPPEMQECVFERFARGSEGAKISGHGLGLNLARDLARLHGGDLRLVCSNKKWTQFEVRFRLAHDPALNPRPSPSRLRRGPSHTAAALPEAKVTGVLPLSHRLCSKEVSVAVRQGVPTPGLQK
jgi:signal transduction histidine kinase